MAKTILGLVGPIASGKDTVKKYLEKKYSALGCRFSSILRDVLERINLPNSRENMHFVVKLFKFYASFLENFLASFASMIIIFGHNSFNASVDNYFGASITRTHLAIQNCFGGADTRSGRLGNGILFGMSSPNTMARLRSVIINNCMHFVPNLIAMATTSGSANIAGRNNSFIFNDNATGPASS